MKRTREKQSQQQADEQTKPTAVQRDKANSRQKVSKFNSRQRSICQVQQAEEQSQRQARKEQSQSAGEANQRIANRDKAKYEKKHTTEESGSQPVPDVQQGQ